jgi:chemotaxis protein CheD
MFENAIQIGMAEFKVTRAPEKLASLGLGSCVAFCALDRVTQVGGLAHIMLPSSSIARDGITPGKFADTAVPALLREMQNLGALLPRVQAVIAGGAHMFAFKVQEPNLDIGARNVQSIEEVCLFAGISIRARSVGGNYGRSVLFDLNTGKVYVRAINQGLEELIIG